LLANVYNADLEIKKLSAKLAKTESETEQKLIKKQISDAEKVLKEYVKDYEAIVKGERAPYYVASAYYRTNNDILKAYLNNGEFNAESTFFPETDIHHYV
jgi:5'-deoxynucleotidase YfbR-like HD superfamily hydrolase